MHVYVYTHLRHGLFYPTVSLHASIPLLHTPFTIPPYPLEPSSFLMVQATPNIDPPKSLRVNQYILPCPAYHQQALFQMITTTMHFCIAIKLRLVNVDCTRHGILRPVKQLSRNSHHLHQTTLLTYCWSSLE